MNKFKVGDQVKSITKDNLLFQNLIIVLCDEEDNLYLCYNNCTIDTYWFKEKDLKLISYCENCKNYIIFNSHCKVKHNNDEENKFVFCCRDFIEREKE